MKYHNLDNFLSHYNLKKNRRKVSMPSQQKANPSAFEYAYQQVIRQVIRPSMRECIEKVKKYEGIELRNITTYVDISLEYFGGVGHQNTSNFQLSFLPKEEQQAMVIRFNFFNKPAKNSSKTFALTDITDATIEKLVCEAFEIAERMLKEHPLTAN